MTLTFLNYDISQPRYMYIEHIPFLLVTGSLENDFFLKVLKCSLSYFFLSQGVEPHMCLSISNSNYSNGNSTYK